MNPPRVRGRFITVEGQDGAGKTTNVEVIERFLNNHGIDVLVTREPGGTELGEQIRNLILHGAEMDIAPLSELLLIFAARAQHVQRVIGPALEAGSWVVCDRFTDATYAYQGGGRKLARDAIGTLETLVQETLRPDLTVLFDVDVDTGRRRSGQRASADRFENEADAFKERVRAIYLQRARAEPKRIKVIAADQPLPVVQAKVTNLMQEFVEQCGKER